MDVRERAGPKGCNDKLRARSRWVAGKAVRWRCSPSLPSEFAPKPLPPPWPP